MAEHELKRVPVNPFDWARQMENWAALGLLLLLLSTAVAGITITLIGQDWSTLWRTLLFGLLLGWLLALSRRPVWGTAFVICVIGMLYILLFPGGMIGKILEAGSEFGRLFPNLWSSFQSGNLDLAPLVGLLQDLLVSTWTIITRIQAWGVSLLTGQSSFDPIAASLTWNALIWLVAAWAGWIMVARRDALLAAVPAILLSLETLAYGHRQPLVMYLMLGMLLLLLAVVQQGRRRQFWNQASIAYPIRKGRQITMAALLITVGLVVFSSFAASVSIHRVQEWIDEHRRPSAQQDNELAESLGIAPGGTPVPDSFTAARSPGLPQDHLIGSGPELSQRVVMTIHVENLTSLPNGRPPFYWRAFTYDRYTGDGWKSSTTEQSSYEASQPLEVARASGHILIQQQVHPVEDIGGTLYAAGEPLTVNAQSEAAWRTNGDLFGVRLERAAAYEADSQIPLVNERALRAAGQRYPDWVRQRYLALPADVPDRVRALAIELTAPEQTPYDRARAIEDYLRSFPYTLDVSRPPVGRDVVDYFLFDLKKGYCDYYASSMVVLARAAGIPARLVIGYANGTYNLNSKRFVVTEADAHSWVEIYFPKIGWVTFEPTPSRPPVSREEVSAPTQSSEPPPSVPAQEATGPQGWRFVSGALLALASLVASAWVMIEEWHLNHLPEQAAAVEVYRRMKRYGKYMNVASGLEDTPYEFSTALSHRLQRLGSPLREPAFVPRLIHDLESMSDGIVQTMYRPSVAGSARNFSVLESWRELRGRLWFVWILEQWRALTRNLKEKWTRPIG